MLSILVTWAVILISIKCLKRHEKKHGKMRRDRKADDVAAIVAAMD